MLKFDDSGDLDGILEMAYRIALKWSRTPADADDMAQEAMLRYAMATPKPSNPPAWLTVVVRRLSNRNRLRNLARRDAEATFLESYTPPRADIELQIELSRVVSRLTARHRRVIRMLVIGAQSADIAAAFGCKIRDVGQMVARARRGARRLRNDHHPKRTSESDGRRS
jgi:RNA polymerase sigma factor (sigma-70 family)